MPEDIRDTDCYATTNADGVFRVERLSQATYVQAIDDARTIGVIARLPADQDVPVGDEYRFLAIPTDDAHREAAEELANQLDVPLDILSEGEQPDFLVVLLNRDAELVDTIEAADWSENGEFSNSRMIQTLTDHLPAQPSAKEVYADAMRRAAVQNKRVIVQETATWCGPCHLLAGFLDTHRTWEKDYVWVRMDHRLRGVQELMSGIRDGAEGGIPWIAIVDSDGKRLATSNEPESGKNIGFPSSDVGRAHFAEMLSSTKIRLTADDIAELVGSLGDK